MLELDLVNITDITVENGYIDSMNPSLIRLARRSIIFLLRGLTVVVLLSFLLFWLRVVDLP